MKPKIFIDGEHGTTGLQIRSRMAGRSDVELLSIPEAERRNAAMREDLLNSADVAILCLPDDASKQAVVDARRQQQGAHHRHLDRAPHRAGLGLWLCRNGHGAGRQNPRRPSRRQSRLLSDRRHRPHPAAAPGRHPAGKLSGHGQCRLRLYRRRQADDRADGGPGQSGPHRLAEFPLRPDAQAQACAGDADPRPARSRADLLARRSAASRRA